MGAHNWSERARYQGAVNRAVNQGYYPDYCEPVLGYGGFVAADIRVGHGSRLNIAAPLSAVTHMFSGHREYYDEIPVGAVPGYSRGSRGPRRYYEDEAAVARENELNREDRIRQQDLNRAPAHDAAPARPPEVTPDKSAQAPAKPEDTTRDTAGTQAQPPAAPVEGKPAPAAPQAVVHADAVSPEQKKLNQQAQLALQQVGGHTGGLNDKAFAQNASAEQMDGLVQAKTQQALRDAGFTNFDWKRDAVTQDMVATLQQKATEYAAAQTKAAEEHKPKEVAAAPAAASANLAGMLSTAATVVAPVAEALSPTAAVIGSAVRAAKNSPEMVAVLTNAASSAKDQLVAEAAKPAAPAQQSDIGVSAGGPPAPFFGFMQFANASSPATNESAPAKPAQSVASQPLTAEDVKRDAAMLLGKVGVTGDGKNLAENGAAPTNVGQKPPQDLVAAR